MSIWKLVWECLLEESPYMFRSHSFYEIPSASCPLKPKKESRKIRIIQDYSELLRIIQLTDLLSLGISSFCFLSMMLAAAADMAYSESLYLALDLGDAR